MSRAQNYREARLRKLSVAAAVAIAVLGGYAVAQVELALLEPLHLEQVGPQRPLQGGDRGVEVAVLLLQPRQLLPQLAFFLFGHRHR